MSDVEQRREMADSGSAELENAETWGDERAERRPGVKGTRAVVSVAFSRDDFERVSAWAEQVGKRTSEFIREAALERVGRQGGSTAEAATNAGLLSALLATRTAERDAALADAGRLRAALGTVLVACVAPGLLRTDIDLEAVVRAGLGATPTAEPPATEEDR